MRKSIPTARLLAKSTVVTAGLIGASGPDPVQAGKNLARLIERQLGYNEGAVDNVALRLFIRAYWDRVSMLAHVIHNEA